MYNCRHSLNFRDTNREVVMKQTRLVEFQRPEFGALRRQDREAIYQAVRNRFGPNHPISMSELEYEYERRA
jgi:hypothetical protein